MLKTIAIALGTIVFFGAMTAMACKPAPLPKCNKGEAFPVNGRALSELRSAVSSFQSILSKHVDSKGQHSCFNNGFGVHYVNAIEGSNTCTEQIALAEAHINKLIWADSPEWKTVSAENARDELKSQAELVEKALKKFQRSARR